MRADFGFAQDDDLVVAYRDVHTCYSAAQSVADEYLGLRSLVVDGQVPGAVQQLRIIERGYQRAVTIEELERSLSWRRDAAWVAHGQVPHYDEAPSQNAKRGVQPDQARGGEG
jgi:hypothetical protein